MAFIRLWGFAIHILMEERSRKKKLTSSRLVHICIANIMLGLPFTSLLQACDKPAASFFVQVNFCLYCIKNKSFEIGNLFRLIGFWCHKDKSWDNRVIVFGFSWPSLDKDRQKSSILTYKVLKWCFFDFTNRFSVYNGEQLLKQNSLWNNFYKISSI